MNFARILNHIAYAGTSCPAGVHPARWRGILRWLARRGYIASEELPA